MRRKKHSTVISKHCGRCNSTLPSNAEKCSYCGHDIIVTKTHKLSEVTEVKEGPIDDWL